MAEAALIWRPELAGYDLGESHPLDPIRLTLSVELMRAYGILGPDAVVVPDTATDGQLELVHDRDYIEAVREASDRSSGFRPRMGLGTADDPIFAGMHEVSARICGASIRGLEEVVSGRRGRTFSIAGGLHHAHRDRAAGFCVYNDPAVAIAVTRLAHPNLRVLYVDIDAHHGDGVQEAFYDSAEVMTVSIHESGSHLFPGTGFPHETGAGDGIGYAANVPLPPYATDECFRLAFDGVVAPLARAFRPDVVVAQLGIDAHHDDPLTHLGMTLPGYRSLVDGIVDLAEELCDGRLAAEGGGGYRVLTTVPLAWTWVMGRLLGTNLAEELPEPWRRRVRPLLGAEPPHTLGAEDSFELPRERARRVLEETRKSVAATRAAVFPHHALMP